MKTNVDKINLNTVKFEVYVNVIIKELSIL